MKYEIAIGIPSYNEGENIAYVAEQIDKGLQKYYKNKKAIIINLDGNSEDNTVDFFLNAKTKTEKLVLRKKGVTGKGNVFKQFFRFSQKHYVKYCMVSDSDLKSIRPDWVKHLVGPVIRGYDLVVPYYTRHKYDGTITNHLCFPLVYALFDKNIRQPIGGDFGFSRRMVDYWLKLHWTKTTGQFGIDIFMTLNAINGKFNICQSNLGVKIHRPSGPRLSFMFLQVIDTLLYELKIINIQTKKNVDNIRILGPKKIVANPKNVNAFKRTMHKILVEEFKIHIDKIENSVTKEHFDIINTMIDKNRINIDANLWCKIVYDCIAAYKKNERDALKTLQILYFARKYTFMGEAKDMSNKEANQIIINQAKIFRKNRNYLLKQHKYNIT